MIMKYNAELDAIPMRVYISVVLGTFDGEFDCPLDVARAKLKFAYCNIIGGRKMSAEILKQADLINLNSTFQCLTAIKNLLSMQRDDLVVPIMHQLGYDVNGKSVQDISAKVDNLLRMAELKRMRMEIARAEKEKKGKTEELTAETFVRERVAMMSYYKMQFDLDRMTAAEYAYMLKRMCDELERDSRAAANVRTRRK